MIKFIQILLSLSVLVLILFTVSSADSGSSQNSSSISSGSNSVSIDSDSSEVSSGIDSFDKNLLSNSSPSSIELESSSLDNSNSNEPQTQSSPSTEPLSNPNAPTIQSPAPYEFTSTIYYNASSALGISGSFHLVGFDTVRLNAHTNGNVLANTLYANANFGTNNLSDELSYIVNYEQINSGSATSNTHVLTVGSANSVEYVDNGNAIAVNAIKLDRPKTVWKDDTVPFIDLTALKSQAQTLSATLSGYQEFNITKNLNTSGGSVDTSYIELTDSNHGGVFNTTATELSSLRYLGVKGFFGTNSHAVIINVDCEGTSQLNLPISLISVDGHNQSTSETHTFTNGRVLWNFYNLLPGSATSINASLLHGSVLAGGASVTATQNLNGTIIADNININAESHRDDFISEIPTPPSDTSLTVNKLWFNSDNAEMDSTGFSAVVQLLEDGISYGTPITLDESNGFSHTFQNLSSDAVYTVQEQTVLSNGEDVSAQFEPSVQYDTDTITLTNTMKAVDPITLPATGGYSTLTTAIGLLAAFISIILLFQLRRNK